MRTFALLMLLLSATALAAPQVVGKIIIPTTADESTFPATAATTRGGLIVGTDGGTTLYLSPGDGGAWQAVGSGSAPSGWISDGGSTATPLSAEVGGARGISADAGFLSFAITTPPALGQNVSIGGCTGAPGVGVMYGPVATPSCASNYVLYLLSTQTYLHSTALTAVEVGGVEALSCTTASCTFGDTLRLGLNSSLDTCTAGIEGEVSRDVLSGVATGKRTKICVCTSDGSSVYKWQNLATGTLGTTTTCGTE